MTTYCTVPWRWHSDTAVMLVGLGSATAVTTCGARWRSVRGAGEPASPQEAASSPYRAEARRAEDSRAIVRAIRGKRELGNSRDGPRATGDIRRISSADGGDGKREIRDGQTASSLMISS
jgi:hypothetical protein